MERRHLTGDAHALVATGLERAGFLAAFTERGGGFSSAPFGSLNLGFATGDDPPLVERNREVVRSGLGVPRYAVAGQRHGTDVVRIGPAEAGAGFAGPADAPAQADVLASSDRGVPVAVLVADCLPVVLASAGEGLLAAVHAGWRGLAAGILVKATELFRDPAGVAAAIGPTIGPCHYDVGRDVAEAVAAGSGAGAVIERRDGRTRLDLPRTAARVLTAAGITTVEQAGVCTACEPERFYSHRRDGVTGRQAVVAMRL